MDKIPTGVEGLDLLLMGGILRGQSVLIEGAPGTGKTTFGLQFIVEGVEHCNEAGLIVTFEQFPAQIYRDAANFGWDLPAMEARNMLRVVCTSPEVLRDQVQQPEGLLDEWIQQMGARRILIDSVSHFEVLSGDAAERRSLVMSLLNALKLRGLTLFVTKEAVHQEEATPTFENYIADAVIHVGNLSEPGTARRRQRFVEVLKTRAQDHVSGRHFFRFGPEGIEVFPRQVAPDDGAEPAADGVVPTGVAGLDHLLSGGLPDPSALLLSGETGAGKTILGLQFLQRGAERGEPGVLFLYQEHPAQVQRVAAGFGWDIERLQAEGMLRVIHAPFATLSLSEHLWTVRAQLEDARPKRVVFDSLSAMLHEVSHLPHMAKERTDQLVRLTKGMGATSILISEVPVGSPHLSTYGVEESLADAVVLLRTTKEGARRKRGLEIFKARGVNHVMGEHRMRITPAGLKVFYRPVKGAVPDDE